MPNWFSGTYRCAKCELVFTTLVDRDNRPEVVPCEREGCDGAAGRTIAAPMVLKSSWPDHRREPGMQKLKEASSIELEMYDRHHDDRAAHQKEIDKLKSTEVKK